MDDTRTNRLKRSHPAAARLASKAWPIARKGIGKAWKVLALMVVVTPDDVAVSAAKALLTAIINLG